MASQGNKNLKLKTNICIYVHLSGFGCLHKHIPAVHKSHHKVHQSHLEKSSYQKQVKEHHTKYHSWQKLYFVWGFVKVHTFQMSLKKVKKIKKNKGKLNNSHVGQTGRNSNMLWYPDSLRHQVISNHGIDFVWKAILVFNEKIYFYYMCHFRQEKW